MRVPHYPVFLLVMMGAPHPTAAMAQDPADPRVARADSLYRAEAWSAAARSYRELTAAQPAEGRYWYRLGVSEEALGRFSEAERALVQALAHAPPGPVLKGRSWYHLATVRARQGRREPALTALDSAIATGAVLEGELDTDSAFARIAADPAFAERKLRLRQALFPCDTMAAARQFDFWMGTWEVYNLQKQRAGTNVIEKILNGCALLENWTGSFGGTGKSLNWFNSAAGYWQQTWVSDRAFTQEYRVGRLDGSTLRFQGEQKTPQGQTLRVRLSFTPLAPDRVRQHAENSSDGGATWTTVYDFLYLRQGSGEQP
jgi:tetratricopeptide (TPR) repeat protein